METPRKVANEEKDEDQNMTENEENSIGAKATSNSSDQFMTAVPHQRLYPTLSSVDTAEQSHSSGAELQSPSQNSHASISKKLSSKQAAPQGETSLSKLLSSDTTPVKSNNKKSRKGSPKVASTAHAGAVKKVTSKKSAAVQSSKQERQKEGGTHSNNAPPDSDKTFQTVQEEQDSRNSSFPGNIGNDRDPKPKIITMNTHTRLGKRRPANSTASSSDTWKTPPDGTLGSPSPSKKSRSTTVTVVAASGHITHRRALGNVVSSLSAIQEEGLASIERRRNGNSTGASKSGLVAMLAEPIAKVEGGEEVSPRKRVAGNPSFGHRVMAGVSPSKQTTPKKEGQSSSWFAQLFRKGT